MENKKYHSLKTRLFLWYVFSLIILVAYFFLFIHFYMLPYGIQMLAVLFVGMATAGFAIIFRITRSLTYLSGQMEKINQKNLGEKITGIKSRDEIGLLADNFNKLMERLNEAFQREKQFISDIAHEMKTPLATLRSSMEVALQKDRNNEEYKKVLHDSIAEVDKLTLTLKNVLDLAWSEAPRQTAGKEKIDLSGMLEELADIGEKLSLLKKIKVKTAIQPDISVKGMQDRLAKAVLNIIENAVKYTPDGGLIKITLETVGGQAVIVVEDNGIGIPEEEIPHIFDRFYRGAKSEKIFGAGLGLAIAKSIIGLHMGDIKVSSKTGKGTAFILRLPL